MFAIFAGWSGEQGSFLLKRLGSIGLMYHGRACTAMELAKIRKFQLPVTS